jgi:hypothetical protein
MNGIMHEAVNDLIVSINNQKEDLINERLFLVCDKFNFEEEKIRRFKNILHESHPNRDSYYYNDGSLKGIHLVTFYKEEFNLSKPLEFNCSIRHTFSNPE